MGAHKIPDSIAILDIGSNSVRMVGYDLTRDVPRIFFNEKVVCGLGRDLQKKGTLSKKGAKRALKTLSGFRILAGALNIKYFIPVATAAVRDAKDGKEFIKKAEKKLGAKIRVLSGEEEAILSAYGTLSLMPDANGLFADFGGGSIELATLGNSKPSAGNSIPAGALCLLALEKGRKKYIREQLATLNGTYKDHSELYAVGGSWRAFAEAFQISQGSKDPHSHNFQMTRDEVMEFSDVLTDTKYKQIVGQFNIEKKRAHLMPYAAMAISTVVDEFDLQHVTFSNAGLRDGIIYCLLNHVDTLELTPVRGRVFP